MSAGLYPLGPLVASGLPEASVTTRARHAAKPARAAGQVRSLPCPRRAAGDADDAGADRTAVVSAAPMVTASQRRLMWPPDEGVRRNAACSLHCALPGVQ